jgi:DNA-binding transcriptional ArsR family regulator
VKGGKGLSSGLDQHHAEIFKALSHPIRIAILNLLREGERCVCEFVPALEIEQPNVSRHLAVLKREGIISSRKDGLKMIYKVKDPKVFDLLDLSKTILQEHWREKTKLVV